GRTADGDRPWTRRWRAALGLLRATDPQRAAETTALLRCLVPVARPADDAGAAVSATFRAAPGAILATLPHTAADLAEVLVHETQHTKLAVLHDLVPLHDAGPAAVYRVAWRPDPRPLAGVFQGTYAHLALAEFWDRAVRGAAVPAAVREEARARRDSYRRQVAEAVPILLESSELTPAGREFATGMERLLASLGRAGRMASGIADASSCDDVQ
ncbi:aKG-HExxH-type peptide beta-hydroxylase, partial [Streptomyces huiliensis]|uniref:aKG-HExxH-type peptide beta-hydroxylase n=1 Tax=Streptomyces huiliensis TaxID=2876027 RepID=UPI0021DF9886